MSSFSWLIECGMCVVLLVQAATGPPIPAHEESLTASQVLTKCKAAMNPPIHYTQIVDGVELEVWQKSLQSGGVAIRLDMRSPIKKSTLVYGDGLYDVYPDNNVVFDIRFMRESALSGLVDNKLGISANEVGGVAAAFREEVVRDGQKCYVIDETIDKNSFNRLAIAFGSPSTADIPAFRQHVIRKDTFQLVELAELATNKTSLSKTEYRNIMHDDPPDELFLPPDGVSIKRPTSMAEYVAAVGDLLKPDFASAMRKFDDLDAAYVAAGKDATDKRLAEAMTLRNSREFVAVNLPQPHHSSRLVFIIVNIAVFTVVLGLILFRRLRFRK